MIWGLFCVSIMTHIELFWLHHWGIGFMMKIVERLYHWCRDITEMLFHGQIHWWIVSLMVIWHRGIVSWDLWMDCITDGEITSLRDCVTEGLYQRCCDTLYNWPWENIIQGLYDDEIHCRGPASIATLAQRRHWSASSRSAADVAPTLVFRRLRCYGMLAFCRSATVGVS